MAKFVFPQPIDYSEVGGADGPPGPPGPVGPTGPAGGSSGTFIHEPGTAPAIERDTQDRLRDSVHLFDFIPVAEHAAIMAATRVSGVDAYDCLPAIHAALREFSSFDADLSGASSGAAPALQLPFGKLYISGPIELRAMCTLQGAGGAYSGDQAFTTRIEVAANQHGIIVHHNDTYAQHKAAPFWASAQPHPFWQASTNPSVPAYAFAGWSMVENDGGKFYRCITTGIKAPSSLWNDDTVYAVGDRRRNGSNCYIVTNVTGDATSAASGGPTGTGTGIVDNNVTWAYLSPYGGPAGTGSDIVDGEAHWAYQATAYTAGPGILPQCVTNYPSSVYQGIYECMAPGTTLSTVKPEHAGLGTSQAYADGYTWKLLEDARGGIGALLQNFALRSLGGTQGHGIWLRARASIREVHIASFPGNGINIQGTTNGPQDRCGNTNNWRIWGSRITGCGQTAEPVDYGTGEIVPGSGVYVQGSDANAGLAIGVDCSNNGAWGFLDDSLLGNNYIACHTNTNGRRARRVWSEDGSPLATVLWQPSTAYSVGDRRRGPYNDPVTSVADENTYECVTAGTSAPSGDGPTGKVDGVVDGSVVWNYIREHGYVCTDRVLAKTVPPSRARSDAWTYIGLYNGHHPVGSTLTPGPLWYANDPRVVDGGSYDCRGISIANYAESGDPAKVRGPGGIAIFSGFGLEEMAGAGTVAGGAHGVLISAEAGEWTQNKLRIEKKDAHDVKFHQSFGGSADNGFVSFAHPVWNATAHQTEIDQETGAISHSQSGGMSLYQTLQSTRQSFGRSAPVPHALHIPKLFLGTGVVNPTAQEVWLPDTAYEVDDCVMNDPATLVTGKTYICREAGVSGSGAGPTGTSTATQIDPGGTAVWAYKGPTTLRQVTSATAVPASGNWAAGDFVFNAAPLLGEPIGWRCILSGTPGTWQPLRDLGSQQTLATNANFTLTPGTSPYQTLHTGTLTADRTVTLSTTGALVGLAYKITRTGGGAFNLNVGTGPLKALATNSWGEFTYDGSAYYLSAYGTL